MCQPATDFDTNNLDRLRDGTTTDTQDYTNMETDTLDGNNQRKTNNVKLIFKCYLYQTKSEW